MSDPNRPSFCLTIKNGYCVWRKSSGQQWRRCSRCLSPSSAPSSARSPYRPVCSKSGEWHLCVRMMWARLWTSRPWVGIACPESEADYPQVGMICLRFKAHFPEVGISSLQSGLRFPEVGISSLRMEAYFFGIGMSSLQTGSRFSGIGMSSLQSGSRFSETGMSSPRPEAHFRLKCAKHKKSV